MQLACIKCFLMAIKLTAGVEDTARLILIHKVHCICISAHFRTPYTIRRVDDSDYGELQTQLFKQ